MSEVRQQQVTKGREAKELRDNLILQEALSARRKSVMDALGRDGLTDDELRRLYFGYKAQLGFEAYLDKMITTGDQSAALLAEAEAAKQKTGQE